MAILHSSTYKYSEVAWLCGVPGHWKVQRLKDAAFIMMGQSPPSEHCSHQQIGLPFLQGCAEFGLEHPIPIQYCRAPAKVCPDGALLLSVRAPVGKINIADQCYGIGRGLCAVTSDDRITSAFVKYFLHVASPELRIVATGSTYDAVSVGDVGNLRIPVPPKKEQSTIARFLDHATYRIDRYVRAKEKLIALLEEQNKAIIHDAVTGRINVRTGRPYSAYKSSGVEWLGRVPANWNVRRVKSLFRLRVEKSGSAHGKQLLSIYTHIGVRPRKDLEERGNKASTTDDYWIVKMGDIVVNKLLAWMGAIGVSRYDGVTSPAYDILAPSCGLTSDYYHHLFRTNLYLQQFRQRSRGIMDMRLRLYFDQFGQILVPVPSIDEQKAILNWYNETTAQISQEIQIARREIYLLSEYRTRLIADVVTGKLDVREAANALPDVSPSVPSDQT